MLCRTMLSAAAERLPWEQREDLIFWRGGETNAERKILAQSGIVQDSGIADVHLMTWRDPDAFQRNFTSLADHCSYK